MNEQQDLHLLSGAYVVGALHEAERAGFEEHLETCADCRAEVAGLSETAALLAETSATPPPPQVREAVLTAITSVRPLPPVVTPIGETSRRRIPRRRWLTAVAAAAVAIVVGVGIAWQPWDDGGADSSQQLTTADRVLAASDAQTVEQRIGDATAKIVVSRSQGRAVLVTEDMPPAPEGKVYELWLQTPEDDMVPAGLMPAGADQTVVVEGDASEAVGVGITVEPAGGSEEPTLPAVAVIELP